MEYKYCKVKPGTLLHISCTEFLDSVVAARKEREKAMVEYGAVGIYGNSSGLSGLCFDSETTPPTDLWRRTDTVGPDGEHVFLPNKRTSGGRLLAKRLSELKLPSLLFNFRAPSVYVPSTRPGLAVYKPSPQLIGKDMILIVPIGPETAEWPTIQESSPLKASEYHQLLEAREEALPKEVAV